MAHPNALPEGYVLEGRYVLGSVSRTTAGGIVYTAFDKKLRIMAEVLEYLPSDCALARNADGTEIQGDTLFREKCMRLLADGSSRMHSADSNIYDVLSANGTAYLVHVAPKNNTVPDAAAVPAVPSAAPPDQTDDEQTRVVEGLFAGNTVTPSTAEKPDFSDTAEELLQDTASPAAVRQPEPVHDGHTPKKEKGNTPPDESVQNDETSGGPSVKLLLILLAAGVILLLICCAVFLSSLFRITDLPGGVESLMGVPYTELADVTDEDWLVVGRGFHDGYAPGMVVAEEEDKNGFRVLINGHTPSYSMPELTGMTADGAAALLNRTHFTNAAGLVQGQVTLEWKETEDAPHGMVLDQSPAAGAVTKSSLVTLTVADNPRTFKTGSDGVMEDLVGTSYAPTLSGHPVLISDRILSDRPAGEILSQYPAAGSAYPKDAPCYVVVSMGSGGSHVPDVQFMTLAEAEKALYACGLSFTVEYALQSHVQTGLIASQQPAAGEAIPYGETVTLTISGEGKWEEGPQIQTSQSEVVLTVGDTCTMELGSAGDTVYHSTSPDVVSVAEDGTVSALAAGSAVVTASTGGRTVVMYIEVAYDKRLPGTVNGTVGEKISLPALGDASDTGTLWYSDDSMVSITDKGVMTGKKAGSTLVRGEKDGKVSLFLVQLTEAKEEKKYVSVAKSLASDRSRMQNALEKGGLHCTVQEEYNEKAAGSVLRIQYSGYSDDTTYYFAEGSTVTLVVSRGRPAVTSISVASKPSKTTYQVGEKLNTAGLTLKVVYADKTEATVTKGFTVSYDFTTAGRKTVAVSYEQRKTSFAVEVIDNSPVKAEIESMPDKLQYSPGDSLDTAGLKVKVTYGNGTTKTFTSGFTTRYSFGKTGTSRVTVTVEGVSAHFDVTVAERKVRSIALDALPTKTTYTAGDALTTAGMTLKVQYTDGTTETVRSGWSVQCDLSSAGKKTVHVSYGGKTTTFSVTVEEAAITGIQVVTMPTKLNYVVGDTADLAGLELSVSRGGSSTLVSWPDSGISFDADLQKAGDGKITVYYGGFSDTIRISVNEPKAVLLTILTLPEKTEYTPEEELDTTGMVLLVEYENGITERIREGYKVFYDFSETGTVIVSVAYKNLDAEFTVQVKEAEKLLSLSAEEISIAVGEKAELEIRYEGKRYTKLSYTIDAPSVVEVTNGLTGLSLLGLQEGVCTITVSDGKEEVSCVITVLAPEETDKENDTDPPEMPPVQGSMEISHQTDETFMPLLTFTGNGVSDVELPFQVTVTFDPEKLIAADFAGLADGVAISFNGTDTIVFSGTITVPKNGNIDAGYIMFFGTDMDAFQITMS